MKRVLLVSAHPDDMEIGMGGMAAKLAAAGDEVLSVVITDGRRSPDPDAIGQDAMAKLRKEEGERACEVLGINKSVFFGFESLSDEGSVKQGIERLVEVIGQFQPDETYTLHPELDRHSSHRVAGKVTLDAARVCNLNCRIWAYEVWGLFPNWDRFEDISAQMETKLAAIREHRSQLAAIQYDEGITGLNRWRAVFADPHQQASPAKYAEVFIKLN